MAPHPLQIVLGQVSLPWVEYDWRDVEEEEQLHRLDRLLDEQRQQGFQLEQAPLMRCQLVRLSDSSYRFVWNHHHLLMDGWCLQILFQELMTVYAFFVQNSDGELPVFQKAQPFRRYISWLQEQDETEARAYWKELLQGFDSPNAISLAAVSQDAPVYREQERQLSPKSTAALMELSRSKRLTLNTLLQGAWALLLSRYSGDEDVVFGVTVSGRQASLSGINSMLGLFINTLPLRVGDFDSDRSLLSV